MDKKVLKKFLFVLSILFHSINFWEPDVAVKQRQVSDMIIVPMFLAYP